jgi:hypothetical protein
MGAQDQRPNFYEGQFLAAEDLAAIVDYLRGAQARHALGAHTWGIAIGLYLLERPAPGAADHREIILTPGVAWDGYGRAIVVTRPTRLPEDLFAGIPFDASVDGGATPKGRAVRVWLNYTEIAARQPAPGFESCSSEEQNARVAETFDFVLGAVPEGPNRHGNIVIGTETLQATEALSRFDPSAPPLYDESVPHQAFPSGRKPPRWLVPVGIVRWVAREDSLGYLAAGDGVPDFRIKDCTRAFRKYIGAVVENLVAADGAIVLQRRDREPNEHHKLAWLLACGRKSEELLDDLAWIEGNLRVVGDAKLAGGKLLMRDADGDDEGAPIYLARTGDDPNLDKKKCCDDTGAVDPGLLAKAPREFRAAIGAKGQNEHRFIVGPEVPPDEEKGEKIPSLAPRFVVTSGAVRLAPDGTRIENDSEGRAGVNTPDPHAALEVSGNWNKDTNEDGAVRISGKQPTIRYEGGDDVDNRKWITQITEEPKGAFRIAYRVPPATAFGKPDWNGVLYVIVDNPSAPDDRKGAKAGIRTDAPGAPLGVRADGEHEDLVSFEDKGGGKKWKIRLKPDAHSGLTFTEVSGDGDRLFLKPGGDIGIGTTDPQGRLTINGKVQPQQGKLSFFTGSYDVEYDGGDDQLFIWRQNPAGITSFMNATIGIGTTAPTRPLSVRGARATEELVSFEDASGATKWHFNQKLAAAPVKGFNIAETGVADGRLFIKEGGDVGIGTYDPKQKLHVAGQFLLVDGRGNEQAYIGGDGSTGSTIGGVLSDWFTDLSNALSGLNAALKVVLLGLLGPFGIGLLPSFTVAYLQGLYSDPFKVPVLMVLANFVGLPWPPPSAAPDSTKDVQIGSLNSAVKSVHFWNASVASPGWMAIGCLKLFEFSDERLKTAVRPLEGSLNKVRQLRGVGYRYALATGGAQEQIGLIAQEVAEVFPEAVSTQRGMQAVSYTSLVPLLIESVKELKSEVDELRAQVEALGGGPAKKEKKKSKKTPDA